MFDNYPDLLTINDLQKALGVGRSIAYKLINDGSINHFRIGSAIRIPKNYLVDYINESCYNHDTAMDLSSI